MKSFAAKAAPTKPLLQSLLHVGGQGLRNSAGHGFRFGDPDVVY